MSNPNKSNQHKPDPRQALFLSKFLDPKSETFANYYKSAISAGYSKNYAESITTKDLTWLEENVGDNYLVQKAEKNLKEFLEDKEDKRIKADITKFVLERLKKEKYSPRSELTGKDGENLTVSLVEFIGEENGKGKDRVS